MGKPLISDAVMRGMYRTMQYLRAAKLDPATASALSRRERSRVPAQPESVYAALLGQLHRRDTLLIEGNAALVQAVVDKAMPESKARPAIRATPGTSHECAAYAAGIALQQTNIRKSTTPRPVVIASLNEFPAMPGVLQLIEQHGLSVLLIVQGESQARADAQRLAASTKVPIMPVDAVDAVAVCRVLQECLLRARNGWGGAVVHALRLPDAGDSIALLEAHLRKRNLLAAVP